MRSLDIACLSQAARASLGWSTVPPGCATIPDVDVIPTWAGDQQITGGVIVQTLSGATVAVKRSRGTLLATNSAFEPAPSTPVTVRVICN